MPASVDSRDSTSCRCREEQHSFLLVNVETQEGVALCFRLLRSATSQIWSREEEMRHFQAVFAAVPWRRCAASSSNHTRARSRCLTTYRNPIKFQPQLNSPTPYSQGVSDF
ncbi:hypothetical protein PIB30_083090 [Stylosanthes scabra]|uniref:Uncharacterized protein n=1 Tax=Stylosanthes scabra TaxID=79078 RepID=A0ABU6YU20_9FABA|nr:hypothetical protein [Stylosanthes scabra]